MLFRTSSVWKDGFDIASLALLLMAAAPGVVVEELVSKFLIKEYRTSYQHKKRALVIGLLIWAGIIAIAIYALNRIHISWQ